MLDAGDHAVIQGVWVGTNDGPFGPFPATGRRVEVPFANVMRFDDQGRIALVRAVASIGDRDSMLAEASRRFWSTRLEPAGQIVERAISRGEIPPETDPGLVVEAVIAAIYFRLLMSGESLDGRFVEGLAEFAAAGASAPGRAR